MVVAPLVFVKMVELKLEDSVRDVVKSIEPLLTAYKGADIRFQEKDSGMITEFSIGAGVNTSNASISIVPNSSSMANFSLKITSAENIRKIDILIEDILLHIISALKTKEKGKIVEKGKICPECKILNEVEGKFCKECGFNFLNPSLPLAKPALPQLTKGAAELSTNREKKPETMVETLNAKYPDQYECELCEMKCAYKDPFILILTDNRNLQEPFKKFDEFLRTKDITMFSDYIYEYASGQMKNYTQFSNRELNNIAYCIFAILSFHILMKADQKIRLTFASKMKERINLRFNREHPSISGSSLLGTEAKAALPSIKTGTLRIEENRCPYCYKKFDERTLKLKIKGYVVECPNCGYTL
jgi:hypothetical protein